VVATDGANVLVTGKPESGALLASLRAALIAGDRLHRLRRRLLIASLSSGATRATHTILIPIGFMLFNFMTNMGPNPQTYLLAGEVFPTHIRRKAPASL
jgi:p-aminobenzoyl-glutamate transporter AbgT